MNEVINPKWVEIDILNSIKIAKTFCSIFFSQFLMKKFPCIIEPNRHMHDRNIIELHFSSPCLMETVLLLRAHIIYTHTVAAYGPLYMKSHLEDKYIILLYKFQPHTQVISLITKLYKFWNKVNFDKMLFKILTFMKPLLRLLFLLATYRF